MLSLCKDCYITMEHWCPETYIPCSWAGKQPPAVNPSPRNKTSVVIRPSPSGQPSLTRLPILAIPEERCFRRSTPSPIQGNASTIPRSLLAVPGGGGRKGLVKKTFWRWSQHPLAGARHSCKVHYYQYAPASFLTCQPVKRRVPPAANYIKHLVVDGISVRSDRSGRKRETPRGRGGGRCTFFCGHRHYSASQHPSDV